MPSLWAPLLDNAEGQRITAERTDVLQAPSPANEPTPDTRALDPITNLTRVQKQTLSELRRRLDAAVDGLQDGCSGRGEKSLGDTNAEDAAAAVRRIVGLCDSLNVDVGNVTANFRAHTAAFATPVVTTGLIRLGSVLHSARSVAEEEKRELQLLSEEVPVFEALYKRLEEAVVRGQDVCAQAPLPQPILLPMLGSPAMQSAEIPKSPEKLGALEAANAELLELRTRHQMEIQKLKEDLQAKKRSTNADESGPWESPSAEVSRLKLENADLLARVKKAENSSRAVRTSSPLPAKLAEQLQRVRGKLSDAERLITSMENKSQAPNQPVSALGASETLQQPAMKGHLSSLENLEQVSEVTLAEAFLKLQEQLSLCRPALLRASKGTVPALTGSVFQAFEHVERLVDMGVEETNAETKGK